MIKSPLKVDEEKPLKELNTFHTYEEAIEAVGYGKFQLLLLLVCGLCSMAGSSETVGVSVIMFAAQCDLHFTLQEKGILATASIFGMLAGLHITGFLCDTRGRVHILKWSMTLSMISSFLSLFSTTTWMLIFLRFLTGVFISAAQSCVFTFLSEFHSSRTKTIPMTILSSCLVTGILYVNVMSYLILPIDFTKFISGLPSWRVLLLLLMAPSAMGLIGLVCLPESPKYLLSQGHDEKAFDVLRMVYSWNRKSSRSSYPIQYVEISEDDKGFSNVRGAGAVIVLMWDQTLQLLEKKRILQTLNMCTIDFIICVIGVGITMWLPTILNYLVVLDDESHIICEAIRIATGHKNNDSSSIDICTDPNGLNISHFKTLIMISMALLFYYIVSSVVVNFIGRKRLLVVWFSLGTICSFSMYWVNIYFLSIFFLTLICQMGKFHGIVVSFAADFYPSSINAMGVSFVVMVSSIGLVVGGNITGTLFLNHCDYMFFGCAAAMLLVVVLTTMLPDKER